MTKYMKVLIATLVMVMVIFLGVSASDAGPTIKMGKKGWMKFSYEMQFYTQFRDTGSGPEGDEATSDIFFRRNRLSTVGRINDRIGFFYSVESTGPRRNFQLDVKDNAASGLFMLDSYLDYKHSDAFRMRIGAWKDQLVREHNEGCFFPTTLDRSLFIYTSIPRVSRDYGLVAFGNLFKKRFQYKLAAMEGIENGNQPTSSMRYTARGHISLLSPESLPLYFGSYLGRKKVLTIGGGYQMEADAVYEDVENMTGAKSYTAMTADIFFEYPVKKLGTITASAAVLAADFDGAYKGADPDSATIGMNGEKSGYYGKFAYLLPKKIGPGKVQFFGRYEQWKFANLSGIYDQGINFTGAGLNYLMRGHNLRMTFEYSTNDYETETADIVDFSNMTAMMQILF